ncbi:MAG TPA: VOC family protein [Candidatus Saccharimonadales bacterium]|jgi:predicted metalloenzyme YecM|nr:VOC family protein [Candidatus Saccharimonadales bacterium]
MWDILGDYKEFISKVDTTLRDLGVSRDEVSMMDHLCYRVESQERYQELLALFARDAMLLGENEVNGRMIATFEFQEYLQGDGWTVPYLELPAPKPGSHYSEGLEHAELVVVGGLARFMDRHDDIAFSLDGMNKLVNPEAGVKGGVVTVKFHELQLGAVVRIEKRLEGRI